MNLRTSFLLGLLAVLFLSGFTYYRSETSPQRLYARYFTAEPTVGYELYRATRPAPRVVEEADLSDDGLVEIAIDLHRRQQYSAALAAASAYLESNPTGDRYDVFLLAATSAMATGDFTAARSYLEEMPRRFPVAEYSYLWYRGLIDLAEGKLSAAGRSFAAIDPADDRAYTDGAAAELLVELGEKVE